MENIIFDITLRNDLRIIPEISHFIEKSAVKLGLSKKKANLLCFTFETLLELRTKGMNENNSEIKVKVIDNGSYLKISVIDFGEPYVLTKNQQAILHKKLVDRYSFEQNGRNGQCFSFFYKYDVPSIKREIVEDEQEELLDNNYSFNILNNNDEEILEAIKCLYSAYGYEYYHQNLYSVDSFKKYMKTGRYTPIIGSNDHHQVMCYCALDENSWFLGVPELANLVTKPIARGCGLGSKIFFEAERIAQELKYEGIHVSAVAYHPYTQKMCNKFNYTPSAIEYSINPKGTGGMNEDRRSDCVIGVKVFNKTKKHKLYLDAECNELFKTIFDSESLNYEIINDGQIIDENDNDLTYAVDTDTTNCFAKISRCGNNIEAQINDTLNKEEVMDCDCITFNLNMNHPNSILGYRALRKLGFICVGCIPGCINGDYMLLQKFKVEPAYEKTVLEDNYKSLANLIYKLNNIKVNES